jgi:hypothetical protein
MKEYNEEISLSERHIRCGWNKPLYEMLISLQSPELPCSPRFDGQIPRSNVAAWTHT